MYLNEVSTLTLEQIPLKFLDSNKNIIPINDLLMDYAVLAESKDNPYFPDVYIIGYYQHINKNTINIFKMDENGTDILFVTGIPKTRNSNTMFRLEKFLWISYWEDNNIGYLYQIIRKANQ